MKLINKFIKFITTDIWRITDHDKNVSKPLLSFYKIIKTAYITVLQFINERIGTKASALTYSTLLAIVPILAILFAIAKGFGFDRILERQLLSIFEGQTETTQAIMNMVSSYLEHTKGGIFIGVGIVMLLWTVLSLINSIETTFNDIWQVKEPRSIYRKLTDYFSAFFLLPILILLSAGASLYISTALSLMDDYLLLGTLSKVLIQLIPFGITWVMFTGLYVFMPNTKVKIKHAIPAGVIAGTVYQFFQFLYISGQIWVSKYNAIYGAFATLPLLLLWLQASWTICLFGAQLTYNSQNINQYDFNKDTRSVSRKYRDFISISIMSIICQRFAENKGPISTNEISNEFRIPIRLVNRTLNNLLGVNLVRLAVMDPQQETMGYQPDLDINLISVGLVLARIDKDGSENFNEEIKDMFKDHWDVLVYARNKSYEYGSDILVKDLLIKSIDEEDESQA